MGCAERTIVRQRANRASAPACCCPAPRVISVCLRCAQMTAHPFIERPQQAEAMIGPRGLITLTGCAAAPARPSVKFELDADALSQGTVERSYRRTRGKDNPESDENAFCARREGVLQATTCGQAKHFLFTRNARAERPTTHLLRDLYHREPRRRVRANAKDVGREQPVPVALPIRRYTPSVEDHTSPSSRSGCGAAGTTRPSRRRSTPCGGASCCRSASARRPPRIP